MYILLDASFNISTIYGFRKKATNFPDPGYRNSLRTALHVALWSGAGVASLSQLHLQDKKLVSSSLLWKIKLPFT